MAHGYVPVGWNRQKRLYDTWALVGVGLYLAAFVGVSLASDPSAAPDTALLRALGTCAFLLLHVVLSIGPLARLDARFTPLLYNRRHLGVLTFLVALAHGLFVVAQYHALGVVNPLVHVLAGEGPLGGLSGIPFQPLGVAALAILFLMAATSHDFWLAHLGPAAWKGLHMAVYAAWALAVLHVATGYLQTETGAVPAWLVTLGVLWVLALHLAAARRERSLDRERGARAGFVDVCAVGDIQEGRARVVTLAGERVAVFRHEGALSAVSNVCRHQNGPLGEGRVIDGCITCPWHGYQYRPADGCSPPPFTEKVETYRLEVALGRVRVDPRALPPGTYVEPVRIEPSMEPGPRQTPAGQEAPFYVGWQERAPTASARFVRSRVARLLVAVLVLAFLWAGSQRTWQPSAFEFGREREFAGVYHATPVPHLRVARPGADAGEARWLLVRPGKHGGDPEWAALDGRAVRLAGSLVFRGEGTLIEVVPGSLRATGQEAPSPSRVRSHGRVQLSGEIVDSKCWLGVMNPGNLRTHRACATLCVRGGIPPLLVVRTPEAGLRQAVLVGPSGEALNQAVLDRIAVPVTLEGELEQHDDLWILRVDPVTIRALGP